jgi:hypothetical protein
MEMNFTKIAYTVALLIVGLGLAVNGYSQSFLTNGLVAYYPFNGNGNDFSGNQNSLTLNSEVQFAPDRFGNPSNALQFANGTAFIQSVNNVGISGNANRTITFWVNHVEVTPWPQSAAVQWGNNSASGGLSTLGVNNITTTTPYVFDHAHVFFGGFNADCVSPALTNVSLGQWHHYAFTYTGNLTTASLFLDGVPVTFTQSGVTTLVTVDTPLKLYGGATNSSVDEVRIYNRALSPSEVQQLYDYEAGPEVALIKAVKPSFTKLTLSTNYQLQVSADLNTWTNQGSCFTATNTSMVYPQYFDVLNWNSLYFRLKTCP